MYAPRTAAGQEHMPPAAHWQYPVPPAATSQPLPPHTGPYYTAPGAAQPPSTLPPLGEHRPADMALRHAPPPPPHHAHYPPAHDPRYPPPGPYGYPPAHAHYGPPPHQPAPRQRTAIACRYCRRRKIRCSGFDTAEDGRCSNCARFSQECVFTPVSAQAQAFVPAHAVYGRPPTQLYGAYGQPLPTAPPSAQDPYGRPPPPGHAAYPPPYGHPAPGPYATPPYDDRSALNGNRKRPNEEPHTPTLPPPNPGIPAAMPRSAYPEQDLGYRYPDPTAAVGPAPTPYAAAPPPPATQQPAGPYYAPQPPARRVSPSVLASPYSSVNDGQRSSLSPNTSNLPPPTTPGLDGHVPPYNADTYRTAAAAAAVVTNTSDYNSANGNKEYRAPTSANGATAGAERKTESAKVERSPPNQTATPVSASSNSSGANGTANGATNGRPGLAISSIVSGDGLSPGGRSTTDSAMLNKLK